MQDKNAAVPNMSFTLFQNEEYCDSTSFTTLANRILNGMVLCANDTTYRICEVEMYLKSSTHLDRYVHGHSDQKNFGHFYFHKFPNGTLKAGTFKGVDLALGNANTYFGVLIRSIQNVDTGEFTEGSCNCVNKILSEFRVTTVKEFLEDLSITGQVAMDHPKLRMAPYRLDIEEIYTGPRIGLSDKYPDFRDLPYRFVIKINNIKKKTKNTDSTRLSERLNEN